jgi:hypothetical protein
VSRVACVLEAASGGRTLESAPGIWGGAVGDGATGDGAEPPFRESIPESALGIWGGGTGDNKFWRGWECEVVVVPESTDISLKVVELGTGETSEAGGSGTFSNSCLIGRDEGGPRERRFRRVTGVSCLAFTVVSAGGAPEDA